MKETLLVYGTDLKLRTTSNIKTQNES
ncbi:uncharacterized protein METZ01_LOCUS408342 [marine metagenome]|uniref:Uncharacterized protein n=1 Tax=marine metagenome TaxID=408172 RepID=A0A382WBI6_9ZZZZ